ncbi:MAG: hypothetical protein JRI25_11350 [Deltaproteobacteria bacterium]|nr:hypothetical protein [Deltaproteobacteria bacterium]
MSARVTDEEWAFLSAITEHDLVEMAVDLDILVPERIDARALVDRCILCILDRAREEGLPFSKYDREDLAAVPPIHLSAIARLQGLPSHASVDRILRVGQRVYRNYQKTRPANAVALLLPSLLPALSRIAATVDAG